MITSAEIRKLETETDLLNLLSSIGPVDREETWKVTKRWDSLCHPLGGFGRLEGMIAQIGAVQGTVRPHLDHPAAIIMGADNGVVAEGVSQCGSDVTSQVLVNMGERKSSLCELCAYLGADVIPVDIGVNEPVAHPGVRNLAVRRGTGNIARERAMSRQEAVEAILTGLSVGTEAAEGGADIFLVGEMGIGNTTTSSAMVSVLFSQDPEDVTGRGAGLSSEGLRRKVEAIRSAIAVNHPDKTDVLDVLSSVGGLDIAGMCGLFLAAALCHVPALIDGYISAVAAYCAVRMCPASRDYFLPSHASEEHASKIVLDALGMEPVLTAGMHLGEATGAAQVLGVLKQTLYAYDHLPTFDGGGVEQYQHLK